MSYHHYASNTVTISPASRGRTASVKRRASALSRILAAGSPVHEQYGLVTAPGDRAQLICESCGRDGQGLFGLTDRLFGLTDRLFGLTDRLFGLTDKGCASRATFPSGAKGTRDYADYVQVWLTLHSGPSHSLRYR